MGIQEWEEASRRLRFTPWSLICHLNCNRGANLSLRVGKHSPEGLEGPQIHQQHTENCFSKKHWRFMSTSQCHQDCHLLVCIDNKAVTMVSKEISIRRVVSLQDLIGNTISFSSVLKDINLKHYFGGLAASVENNLNKLS